MLTLKGTCLTCHAQTVAYKDKQTGADRSFIRHRCCIHDSSAGLDPVYVNTGETPLQSGLYYEMAVRIRPYQTRGGDIMYEVLTYKDHPPQEVVILSKQDSVKAVAALSKQ